MNWRCFVLDPGIIECNIQPSESLDHLLQCVFDLIRRGHITDDGQYLAARVLYRFREGSKSVRRAVQDRLYARPLRRRYGRGTADAACSPCNG